MKPFPLFSFALLVLISFTTYSQPNPPSNLNAVEGQQWNHVYVDLTWTGSTNTTHFVRYNIYRKNGAVSDTGSFVKRYTNIRVPNFRDKNVQGGNTYSYYVTAYNNLGESASSDTVEITLSGPVQPIEVTGTVTSASNGDPINHAFVKFFSISPNATGVRQTFTDSLGNFSLNLFPGNYYMYYSALGFIPEYYDNASSIQNATVIAISSTGAANFNVDLSPYVPPVFYTLSGNVSDSLNNPLRAKLVLYSLRLNSHFPRPGHTVTDSLGNYSFQVKEGDTVVVYAAAFNHNYFPEFYDNKSTFMEADRIGIAGDIQNINFVLQHKPVYANGISGSVADSAGAGVESQVAAFKRVTNSLHHQKRAYAVATDTLGNYNFENMVPGEYILLARPHQDYKPTFFRYDGGQTLNWRHADSVVVDEAGVVTGINFTVVPRPQPGFAIISGTVKDNLSKPVNGAFVYALDENENLFAFAVSDINGRYTIDGLVPGDYQIHSGKVDFIPAQDYNITVDYEANISQSLSFTLNPDSPTGTKDKNTIADNFELKQNFPNPFNPKTTISYSIPAEDFVTIKIFNILGKEVAVILNERKIAGEHQLEFNADNLTSGVYFYELTAGSYKSVKKLVLMK